MQPEPEADPLPEPEPELEPEPEPEPELEQELLPDPEVVVLETPPQALKIWVKVERYLEKELSCGDARKLAGYDQLLLQLEAKELELAELKQMYKTYVPKPKSAVKPAKVSGFLNNRMFFPYLCCVDV